MSTGTCAFRELGLIYLAPGASRFERQHELGHLFDAQYLDDGERNAFRRMIRVPMATPWFGERGQASPSEHLADMYAACRLDLDPARRWETAYDLVPTRRDFRRICRLLERSARDRA